MKYTYQFTKNFEIALDWVLSSQFKDNVFFRFTFDSYSGVRKGLWMSPSQCLYYMRTVEVDFEFKNFIKRVAL